ncbi:MAG TPA: 50S ribosomal protein L25 [Chthonomonadales bacterium]|nr:50S ribosomal protein L25 [Chthonomonadales bacterium]
MSTTITIKPISARTKGEMKRLRVAGRIPVSIQHRGEDTRHFEGEARPLEEFIRRHGESAVLDLVVEPNNERTTAIVRGIQRDPMMHRLLQVTFQRVSRDEPVRTNVPLLFHGEPQSVHDHSAVLQHQLESVEVKALPGDLPEHLTVDVSGLAFGESVRVADLAHSDRIEILTPATTVVASLTATAHGAAAEAAAEELEQAEEISGSEGA